MLLSLSGNIRLGAEVEVRNVSKRFGAYQALNDVDLRVDGGSFVTILGPSGSGKTTLLRIVGGFEMPTTGRVMLDNEDITVLPPERRNVNTSFQGYALFPHMTVRQNIAFGLENKRLERSEIDRRIAEALDLVRLPSFINRKVTSLSGGEQQRIALARAFVNRPKLLLLDEPLSALDLRLRRQMQVELKALQRALGITFIYVTHDQEEALSMSDTIIVMNRAKVEQIGTPDEVYARPRTAFVADFLGESNIMRGIVVQQADERGSAMVEIAGKVLPAVDRTGRPAGSQVTLSLRPEAISLSEALARAPLEGVVAEAIFLGNAWEFIVEVGNARLKVWAAASQLATQPDIGAVVGLVWDETSLAVVE